MEVEYEIVHERQFDKQMARVMGSVERGDAFMRLIEWDIVRGGELGCPLAENRWRLETRDGGLGSLWIDYVRDEAMKRVYLVSITRQPARSPVAPLPK